MTYCKCGHPNIPGSKFCSNCGTSFSITSVASTPAQAPVRVQRQNTPTLENDGLTDEEAMVLARLRQKKRRLPPSRVQEEPEPEDTDDEGGGESLQYLPAAVANMTGLQIEELSSDPVKGVDAGSFIFGPEAQFNASREQALKPAPKKRKKA